MEAPASGGPTFFPKKVGGKKGQGGEFRFSPPCTHPLKRPIRGACGPRVKEYLISFWLKHATGMFLNAKTYWMYPPSCSTGSLPAAKAYFVTPPPLGGDTVGRGILDAPFPSRHKHRGISETWHRRRPGGPSRYNATTFRACRVIPMRVTRGAASSAQATDRSLPGRPESSFPPLGLLSPPNPLRWASAGAPITASTSQWDGRQCRPGLCPVYTAHRRHEPSVSGGAGGTPPAPSFPPFLWEEMGAPAAQARPRGRNPPFQTRW